MAWDFALFGCAGGLEEDDGFVVRFCCFSLGRCSVATAAAAGGEGGGSIVFGMSVPYIYFFVW